MDIHEHAGESSDARFRKVEERHGTGAVTCAGIRYEGVTYEISRFQGMTRAGLPVPGVHRLDGRIELADVKTRAALAGRSIVLHLEDGSVMNLELLDADGRVLAHGHGPGQCRCC